jgi:hypothetical protein
MSYPVPKNQKQLRQFLGTCNSHQHFIVNYSRYIAPLTPLLKKGLRWKWTSDHQIAFEELHENFAKSIHLTHLQGDFPYVIYTDASQFAIAAVLMQVDEEGHTAIISTASHVQSPIERRYSTCEQELLGIIFALQKFRIFIYGSKITVNSDNKALSFIGRCIITSNRIALWVMQLQEHDLEIAHIAVGKNHFADALSRNPTGLTREQITTLTRPRELLVAAVNLNIDTSLKRDLRNLAILQTQDTQLLELRRRLAAGSAQATHRFRLHKDLLYCCDSRDKPL